MSSLPALGDIFSGVGAPEDLTKYFVETCQLGDIHSFLDYVVRKEYESELRDIVKEKFPVQGEFTLESQRLFVTKARGDYRLALETVATEQQKATKAEASKGESEDAEKELDPDTRKRLKETWEAVRKWTPDRSMKPAPALRNRVYREFHGQVMTLHMVEKAVTIEDVKKPLEKKQVPPGTGADERYNKPASKPVDSTLGYVAALRLLFGTYAYCGTHEVPSKKNSTEKVTFFDWGVGLAYCDQAMSRTLKVSIPEHAKLRWLRARDEATRTDMAQLVNEGWPAGEALTEALKREAHFWRMKDDTVAQPVEGDQRERVPKRTREDHDVAAQGRGRPNRITIDKNRPGERRPCPNPHISLAAPSSDGIFIGAHIEGYGVILFTGVDVFDGRFRTFAGPSFFLDFFSGTDFWQEGAAQGLASPLRREANPAVSGSSAAAPYDFPNRLAAAKPIVWRGRGELVCLPWERPCSQLVLVIDMWAGLSGLLVAALSLGLRCIAVSAEVDEELRAAVAACFPNVVSAESVGDLRGEQFRAVLSQRSFAAVLIGGGPLPPGSVGLDSRRRGLDGAAAGAPRELQRLVLELTEVAGGVPILSFLEDSASSPGAVVHEYGRLVGGGYVHTFDPMQVASGTGPSGFHAFTREFRHPVDRIHFASPEAAERFFQGVRRFPAAAYERQSLLWKCEKWRPLDPSERALLHGMPPALVEAVAVGHEQARATAMRNSELGNGVHVPSLMVALVLLFQLAPGLRAASPSHLACAGEVALAHKVIGTPFDVSGAMGADLEFGAALRSIFGPRAQNWRDLQQSAMHRALMALEPVRAAPANKRSAAAQAVARDRDAAGIAFLTALLRWPDRSQAMGYLHGFPVIGDIEASGVFRPLGPQPTKHLDEVFFGQAAVAAVADLRCGPPPRDAEEIWRLAQEEIHKDFTEPWRTAAEMDTMFGVGRWRPLHRFLVCQADGKLRLIDNGHRGRQNEFAAVAETIYTIGIDTVPSVAALLVKSVQAEARRAGRPELPFPEWFRLDMGTDDLPDAFRGCPVLPDHQRAVVVAIWSPTERDWKFGVMKGCPYGLGSVVVAFNRSPTLTTAFQRRVLGLLTGAYFDDVLLMDVSCSARRAKELRQWPFDCLRTPPKRTKAFPTQSHRPFLGAVLDLSTAHEDGFVVVMPKESSRRLVCADIDAAVAAASMSSAQASKTRGRSSWVESNSFGRIGRLGIAVLKGLQCKHHGPLTAAQTQALKFHQHVVAHAPPRHVQVLHHRREVVVIYTDAECEPARLRGRDVIWFVDNEAAAAAGIRGGSGETEVDIMMQAAHLLWMHLDCRVWIEWVDSASNPADGLSRDG
ncbi:unnamed protein product, partial [Prorocentrum cordatum]